MNTAAIDLFYKIILTEQIIGMHLATAVFFYIFHYPVSENLDSFDMSIILFNALQNAYEAAKDTKAASVEVHTFRKKNTFVIRIENTYAKDIHMDEITGLPMTDKSDKCAHGYGLKNIMRIAHKYYGDIQVEADGEKFILNIMIMLQ